VVTRDEQHYPALYTDARGAEETTIANDGEMLRLKVRGVELVGRDFDALGPVEGTPPSLLERVPLDRGGLCSCRLEWRMSIAMQDNGQTTAGMLSVELVLGDPRSSGGLDHEELRLVLEYGGRRFTAPGSGCFEGDLLGIQSQLPAGVYMKACINCLYSDYSPLGSGMFGGMMCFRNLKAEYLRVTSKREFWSVHGRQDRMVQETYLCPEFERRVPGTGYRG
jgi:hypothetical protein